MNEQQGNPIAGAIISATFLVGACIVFASAVVADAIERTSESTDEGGSLGMVAFLICAMYFTLGVGGLYKISKELKK